MSGTLTVRRTWTGRRLEELFRDEGVLEVRNGLTLGDHWVLADEVGRAVEEYMHYADTAFEELSSTTWVRKCFVVDGPPPRDARLSIAGYRLRGRGRLAGTFNGRPFTFPARSNNSWYADWVIAPLPAPVRRGENELLLHTTGSLVFRLFIEPSHLPNRSARSTDGGLTFDDAHLGKGGFIDGEYVIRLSGKRLPREGVVTSPPVQVTAEGKAVAPAGRVVGVALELDGNAPVEVRLGRGPWLDRPGVWTEWSRPTRSAVRRMEETLGPPGPRFIQWRARLRPRAGRAPVLRRAELTLRLRPDLEAPLPLVSMDAPPTVLPGRPFAHQSPQHPRLTALREKHRLDRILARGRDEWEGLLHLAAWVGHYASFRGKSPFELTAPYEVVEILRAGHAREKRVMCGHLAFAFVQLAAACGYTARVILRGNHLVSEVFSPVHRKWAVVDPMDQVRGSAPGGMVWTAGYGGYYHAGTARDRLAPPMSALELGRVRGPVTRRHLLWPSGTYRSRPATWQRDLRWFRREISYPERNNHTDVAEPVFYADVFRYAGHLKYRRGREPAMPYYWHYTSRRGDIEWTVGEVNAFLTAVAPGRVLVQFRSQMPHTRAVRVIDGTRAPREITADSYLWRPTEGGTLSLAAVNALGRTGPVTTCRCLGWEKQR